MSCVLAGQWAWESGLYVDVGGAVRKRNAVKLADTTEKHNGHSYMKNSARLVRRVLLSSDVQFICVDLLIFQPAGSENVHFSFKS